jgi:Hydantoinase B/oxoprolinase/Hydantoinase/oxoprolinase N-terminal region
MGPQSNTTSQRSRIGVDVGGTITDVILQLADGTASIRKLLSTPPRYDRAVVESVAGRASAPVEIDDVVHGTSESPPTAPSSARSTRTVPDSGGAGRHRGGLAVERVWRCETPETSLIIRSDRSAHPPYGLAGGRPGTLSSNLLLRPDASRVELPSMVSTTIGDGHVYPHRMAGGGGWGDPLEREPERVAADVADGKVRATAAFTDYGVVVGEDGTLGADRTRAERDGRR